VSGTKRPCPECEWDQWLQAKDAWLCSNPDCRREDAAQPLPQPLPLAEGSERVADAGFFLKKRIPIRAEKYRPGLEDGFCWLFPTGAMSFVGPFPGGSYGDPGEPPSDSHAKRVPFIKTLEGCHAISEGDWIITGVKGERYPCKADIFEATYEPYSAADSPASESPGKPTREEVVEALRNLATCGYDDFGGSYVNLQVDEADVKAARAILAREGE
jgi:hypothetical protein